MVDLLPWPPPNSIWLCYSHSEKGHPEGPQLWHKHIHGIMLDVLDFKPCTHEHCLDYKCNKATNNLTLAVCQLDNIIISTRMLEPALSVKAQIQLQMTTALNNLGIIKQFNDIDIQQTKYYIRGFAETYLHCILAHHGWLPLPASNITITMQTKNVFMAMCLSLLKEQPMKNQIKLSKRKWD